MRTNYAEKYARRGGYIGVATGVGIGFLASTQPLASLATALSFKAAAVAPTGIGASALAVAASHLVLPLATIAAVAAGIYLFYGDAAGKTAPGRFFSGVADISLLAASVTTIQKITGTAPAVTPVPPDALTYATGALIKPLVCGAGASLIGRTIGGGIGWVRDRRGSPELS